MANHARDTARQGLRTAARLARGVRSCQPPAPGLGGQTCLRRQGLAAQKPRPVARKVIAQRMRRYGEKSHSRMRNASPGRLGSYQTVTLAPLGYRLTTSCARRAEVSWVTGKTWLLPKTLSPTV